MGAFDSNPIPEPARRFTLVGVTYPDGYSYADGEIWERTGSCNRCGECCKGGDPIRMTPPTADTPSGYCGAFVWDDAEHTVGYCLDRCEEYYTSCCVDFPTHPHHLVDCPSCSYVFRQVG